MSDWKTNPTRFSPIYKKRPESWRERSLGMVVELCAQCKHDKSRHFYEKEYPELGFCLESDCECDCREFGHEAGH